MIQLPSIPPNTIIEYQKIIPFSSLYAPQTTFGVLVVGLPSNYVVCATCVRLLEAFRGSTLRGLTCSLGAFVPNSILTDITYYGMALELAQMPTTNTFQTSGPTNNDLTNYINAFSPATGLYFNGPHDVVAYFTAAGANLSVLTAGSVEVTVQIRPL
jgi:hypothetical protein